MACYNSDSIEEFVRDPTTGALSNQNTYVLDSTRMDLPRGVAESPDGKQIYSLSYTSKTVNLWQRSALPTPAPFTASPSSAPSTAPSPAPSPAPLP